MKAIRRTSLWMFILVLTVAPVFAFDCAHTTFSLKYGSSWAVAAAGKNAAIAAGNAVLFFDMSDPAQPKIIAEHRVAHNIDVMAWIGNTLLVGSNGGLFVIDVSDKSSPELVGSIGLGTRIHGIAVDNTTVFVTGLLSGGNGLIAIDVTLMDHPVEIGRFVFPGWFQGITVSEGLAYIADSDNGLQIIDVSNPAEMTSVSTLELEAVCNVTLTNGVAFLNTRWGGTLFSVDVSTPAAPYMLSSILDLDEMVGGELIAVDQLLYVGLSQCWECSSGGGLTVFDIANPAAPVVLTALEFGAGAMALVQLGSNLVACDWKRGLWVIDLEQPEEPVVIAHHNVTFDEVFVIEVQGDLAFLGDRGLRIFDLATGGDPSMVASIEDLGSTTAVAVEQDLALTLGWDRVLTLVDVSDPETPAVLARFEPELSDACEPSYQCAGFDMALADNLVVVVAGRAGSFVIDTSDPTQPSQLTNIPSIGITEVVEMKSNYLYLGHWVSASGTTEPHGVLDIVDISTPAEPLLLATVNTVQPITDIVASGNHLLVLDSGGLRILDVSEPSYPVEIGSIEVARHSSLVVDGDFAYISKRPGAFTVIDLSKQSHPRIIGGHIWQPFTIADSGPLGGFDVAIHNELVLIADGMWGLRVVDASQCLNGPRQDPLIEVFID